MIQKITSLLNADQLQRLRSIASSGNFVDGKLTTVGPIGNIKNNLEIERSQQTDAIINRTVRQALESSQEFRNFVLPRRVTPPIISLYKSGMEYREHTDAALMYLENSPLRTDISTTIFLADPESYDGGELVLQTPFGEESIKLSAGDAVVYSTTLLHRVAPVTRGERVVAVFWCQSLVQDAAKRGMINDLSWLTGRVSQMAPNSKEARIMIQLYTNLMKMWVDV